MKNKSTQRVHNTFENVPTCLHTWTPFPKLLFQSIAVYYVDIAPIFHLLSREKCSLMEI